MTIFAMGCNLGPNQAARHLAGNVTPHMLSYTNRRHLSLEKLDKANRELVELYLKLDLPKTWGDGNAGAADGKRFDFNDEKIGRAACRESVCQYGQNVTGDVG